MNLFLTLAFLFFIGSTAGWVLELFYRHFASMKKGEHLKQMAGTLEKRVKK